MKIISTPLFISIILTAFTSLAQDLHPLPGIDDCDKVQTLLTTPDAFKGTLINDNAYECKRPYILDGFNEARVIVLGNEGKYWTVNMNTEALPQIEAETKYLELIHQLMKCSYLNGWKGGETLIKENTYHFNLKQTISTTGRFKSILVSYYKLDLTELYKVEITFEN